MSSKKPLIERIGLQRRNNQGDLMTIVEYKNVEDIVVEFEDGTRRNATYNRFKTGGISKNPRPSTNRYSGKKNRVGEKYVICDGYEAEIIEYYDRKNCTVLLNDGTILHNIAVNNLKHGSVKNPNHPIVCGIGYFGIGDYPARINGEKTKAYITWSCMMHRAYSDKYHEKEPTYKDVEVCKEWHCFQNYAKWFYENYKECDGVKFELDKDILSGESKIYSPETCCFIPEPINRMLASSKSYRGEYPIGVVKYQNRFIATLSGKHLGSFMTPEEAFQTYKTAKEQRVRDFAILYKDYLKQEAFDNLMAYTVNIDD